MTITAFNWKNKKGTAPRSCNCGSWKNHWINGSNKKWPYYCTVAGCTNTAEVGAHVINSDVSGEFIIPMCYSHNNSDFSFNIKGDTTLVSANKNNTCE